MNQPIPATTLASVLHLRLAEFGTRPVVEQARLRAQLEAVVAAGISVVPERDRLALDAPDGIGIVVLDNPAGALAVAQRCVDAAAVLPLCIGVHHGAVALAGDGNAAQGIVGDGPRSAAVAAGFAKPAQILVTRAFREALSAHAPASETGMRSAGMVADQSVRTYELFVADPRARRRRRQRLLALGLGCMVLALSAGAALRLADRPPAPAAATASAQPAPRPHPAQKAAAPAPATVPAATAAPRPSQPAAAPAAVLLFRVTPGGEVFVDGVKRGSLPGLKQLQLAPGRHALEIRYRREAPYRRTLDLRSGQTVVVQHQFFQPPEVLRRLDKLFKKK